MGGGRGYFLVLKKNFEVGDFFILMGRGGGYIRGGLAKIGCEEGIKLSKTELYIDLFLY